MRLRLGSQTLQLSSGRPLLMGIVNATPDSFSDSEAERIDPVGRARELVQAGAEMIDVGGESARGDRAPVDAATEVARVVDVVREVAGLGVLVSVDTYKPAVAAAAVEAGAVLVNDVSGLRDPGLADVCASTGAGLVVMHTRVEPKGTLLDPGAYEDVVDDVASFLASRIELAVSRGVSREQIVLDPGPDFAKTPAQTVAVLRRLDVLHALGRPVLLALSRKDFVGAITGRGPRERLAGTLAAVGEGVDAGGHILRVHDVAAVREFLDVREVLRGHRVLGDVEGLTPDRYPDGPPSFLDL